MANCFQVPEAVMNLDYARFTTYGDNVNFFNISPTQCKCVKGEDLYTKMAQSFFEIGLAPKDVPMWRDISDVSILQSLAGKLNRPEDAAEEMMTFSKPTAATKVAPAISTKHITINFETGAYTLTDEHRYKIDQEFGSTASSLAGYRIRIQGNTDNVGSNQMNKSLSRKRAQAMADYLIQRYSYDRNRFVVVGNGPDKPIASNDTEEGKAANRRADFELIN
jgi:NitT/TauT family transport system substrate-binding protein